MTIQNIKVTFSRKVKPADYEGADAIVELSGIVPEGEDAIVMLNFLSATAKAKVLEMVGLRKSPANEAAGVTSNGAAAPTVSTVAAQASPAPAASSTSAPAAEPKTRAKRSPPASAPAATAAPSAADIADVASVAEPAAAKVIASDDMSDFLSAPPKPITDVELNDAVQKAFKRLNRPDAGPLLRGAAAKYIPEGKSPNLSNIPQEKRGDYLKSIAVLE